MKILTAEETINRAVAIGRDERGDDVTARESAYILAHAVQRVLDLTWAAQDEAEADAVTLSAADVLAALLGEDA